MDAVSEWVVEHKHVFIYFSMLISLPSMFLYCAEVVLICRHKKFHHSFYALFSIRATAALLYTLDSYLGYRFLNIFDGRLLPLYQHVPDFFFATFYFLTHYTLQADNFATGFILLHRLTSIVWPLKHEKIWRKLLPVAVLTTYCVPFYAVELFQVHGKIFINIKEDTGKFDGAYIGEIEQNGILLRYIQVMAIACIAFLLICTLINVCILCAYQRQQHQAMTTHHSQQQQQQNFFHSPLDSIQRKLFIYALLTFCGHMLIALLMISTYFGQFTGASSAITTVLNIQYPWIVDVGMVVLPSWLLLWASPNFRGQLCRSLGLNKFLRKVTPLKVPTNVDGGRGRAGDAGSLRAVPTAAIHHQQNATATAAAATAIAVRNARTAMATTTQRQQQQQQQQPKHRQSCPGIRFMQG